MPGKKYIEWDGKYLSTSEIAKREKVPVGTLRCWCHSNKYNPQKLRNKIEEYHRKGSNKRARNLFPYRDGRKLSAFEIHKLEPHLSVAMIRIRYKTCPDGDFDAIFAPLGQNKYSAPRRITKDMIGDLGPRRDPRTIQGPTDYERQLWNR